MGIVIVQYISNLHDDLKISVKICLLYLSRNLFSKRKVDLLKIFKKIRWINIRTPEQCKGNYEGQRTNHLFEIWSCNLDHFELFVLMLSFLFCTENFFI